MKKYLCLFLICVLVCSLFTGCNDEILTPPDTEPSTETTVPDIVEPTTPQEPIEPSNLSKTNMSAYVLDKAYEQKKENTMFSPLSLDMALGLVSEGAGSEYHNVFPKLLGKENYSNFASEYMNYVENLNKESTHTYNKYKTVFEIANSVWVSDQYEPLDSYERKIKNYAAEINRLDFNNKPLVVSNINNWCKIKTRDMIDQVISEADINPTTLSVIVNAVYFESPWIETWDISKKDNYFSGFDSVKTETKMIETRTGLYYENDFATAFGCYYKNGLTFIGILPKEKGEFTLEELDIESLLKSEERKYDVNAKMPTFKFDNKIDNLVNTLTELGYGCLFDSDLGMFNQMLTNGNSNVPMTISEIIQVDAIELDENGTKAAAVTAIITDGCTSIVEPKKTKDVILDRPFAFLIYDSEMDQIVFMGKVVDPA